MAQILPFLVVLVCPIGMASMMFLPALGRRFGRRTPRTDTAAS